MVAPFREIELGGQEGGFRLRIRDRVAQVRVGEGAKAGELRAATFGDEPAQLRVEVGEEEERRRSRELLPHEEHRRLRREEQERGGGRVPPGVDLVIEPLAKGAIADLIVVLGAEDEGRSGSSVTRVPRGLADPG